MYSTQSNRIEKLEILLSNILANKSLLDWIDDQLSHFFKKSSQLIPPINIENLLKIRKINKIQIKQDITWGTLRVVPNGFIIEMTPHRKHNTYWGRFVIAHEIAHTLFYDIDQEPPKNLVQRNINNYDLEWLCSYIARNILVPKQCAQDFLDKSKNYEKAFSLNTLIQFERKFRVPRRIMAERLIEDLNFSNCIILQFQKTQNRNNTNGRKEIIWILKWHVRPRIDVFNLYIPWNKKTETYTKSPKVCEPLLNFIINTFSKNQHEKIFKEYVDADTFKCRTTGNLNKLLHLVYGSSTFQVQVLSSSVGKQEVFEYGNFDYLAPASHLLMCISLR